MSKKYVAQFDLIEISIPTVEFCLRTFDRAPNDICKYHQIECDTLEEAREQLNKRLKETYTDCEIAINELKQKQNKILQLLEYGTEVKGSETK